MALSKPKLLQALGPLLLLAALFPMLPNKVHSQKFSTGFRYDSFNPKPADLIFQGRAYVPSNSTFIRLTDPVENIAGRVVYAKPVRMWALRPPRRASFETKIDFVITRADDNPADGLVFFIAPVGTTPPDSAAGNFGIFNSSGTGSHIFAVEFDTHVNNQWDPDYRHIGIDINSRKSVATTKFEGAFGQHVRAHINYDSFTGKISVHAFYHGGHSVLQGVIFDVKRILPEWVQVGISASTGLHVESHDLYSWEFHSSLPFDNLPNINRQTIANI